MNKAKLEKEIREMVDDYQEELLMTTWDKFIFDCHFTPDEEQKDIEGVIGTGLWSKYAVN